MKYIPVVWTARTTNGTNLPAKVSDGVFALSGTGFQYQSTASGTPWWLQADYGSALFAATWYGITPTNLSNQSPNAFTFEGSNDGTTWVVLDTQTAQGVTWPTTGTRWFTFANTTAYRYYRLHVTATGGSSLAIMELEIGDGVPPSVVHNRNHMLSNSWNNGAYHQGIVFRADADGYITHYNFRHQGTAGNYVFRLIDSDMNVLDRTVFTADASHAIASFLEVPCLETPKVLAGQVYMVTLLTPTARTWFNTAQTADLVYGDVTIPLSVEFGGVTGLPTRTLTSTTNPDAIPTAVGSASQWWTLGVVHDTSPRVIASNKTSSTTETVFTSTRMEIEHVVQDFLEELGVFGRTTSLIADHSVPNPNNGSIHQTILPRPNQTTVPGSGGVPSVDPVTGKATYSLVVVDRFGARKAVLTHAANIKYTETLNDGSSLDFTLAKNDPAIKELLIPKREIQFWRGAVLEDWLVGIRARSSGNGTVTFAATSMHWYLDARVIGKVPIPNLLKNGSFEEGLKHWNFTWVEGSIPQAAPIHRIDTDTLNGERSLYIEGSSAVEVTTTTFESDVMFASGSWTLTSAGISAINSLCNAISDGEPSMRIEGHTDSVPMTSLPGGNYQLGLNRANAVKAQVLSQIPGANVTTVSYGATRPVATNTTAAGRAKNRRVEIDYSFTMTAKGHRQYAGQSINFVNPVADKKEKTVTLVGWTKIKQYLGPSKDGWGVYMQLIDPADPKKPVATGSVSINEKTPLDRWTRMECSVKVPADGKTYRIDVRMYPPEGICLWDEISVTSSDQLAYFDVDQALIVKGLIEHAQDPAMGKGPIPLLTNTPLTGVVRTREWPWIQRMSIREAVMEFPTLADGMDITFEFTPTTKTLRTHFPRKGTNRGYSFVTGENVISAEVDIDGLQTTTQVIVQAEGDGSDREEGYWTDTSEMDGLILEKVYNATPGSAISSLTNQAKRGVKRWAHPVIMPTLIMDPSKTDELLANVSLGDVVMVVVNDGWLNLNDDYRITKREIEPKTDQITYTLAPEIELT